MQQSSTRRIAIVGAGPAGLTAARILQQRGMQVTVFEADPDADARDQGGTLDLHAESGQKALLMAGLHAQFMAQARHEDQNMRVLDYAAANVLLEASPPPGDGERPEIDRKALRKLLLSSLAPETVRWGCKLVSVQDQQETQEGGRHVLHFANGSSEAYALVIGADGGWSKVRARLDGTAPTYTGVTFIECWLDDVDTRHPAIARLVGHGTMFSLHDGMGLIAQRNGNGHVRLYAGVRRSFDWARQQGVTTEAPARARGAAASICGLGAATAGDDRF